MKNKFKFLITVLLAFALSSCNIIVNMGNSTSSTGSHTSGSSDTTITDAVKVTSVEVLPSSLALEINHTYQLSAKVLPENATNKEVTWTSSLPTVVSVNSETGLITALKKDSAARKVKIYATSKENASFKSYCEVSVADEVVRATSLSLDKHELTMKLNSTSTLHADLVPSNSTGGVIWTSSDTSVVTVSSGGELEAVGFGTSIIRAKAASNDSAYDECVVTVEQKHVTSVSLDKHSMRVSNGSTTKLNVTVLPADADDRTVSWRSSNNTVAQVVDGEVTFTKAGTVTISVRSNDVPALMDSCEFTVEDVHPTSISMSSSAINVGVNSTSTLSVNFIPENTTNKKVTWSSNNTSVATVQDGVVRGESIGTTTITATSVDGGLKATCTVSVVGLAKTSLKYNYEDFTDHSIYRIDSIPSTGNPKVLIIPVWFTDSGNYIPTNQKDRVRSDIEKAYLGTNEETGWRSVRTYYEQESFGQLHLNGVVTDWYSCDYKSSNVTSTTETVQIVKNATETFRKNNTSSFSSFDTNGDGYLDAVVLIYAAPDYSASHSTNDNLWAYCFWTQEEAGSADRPTPNAFFWASYDFMYNSSSPEVGSYGRGDTRYCNIDTHTFVHEMGHIFGLSDYYDYNGGYSASGGFSMQDYNVGAHDPYSKMALGWVQPYVPKESITLTINPMEDSGDLVLLSPNFTNSPFDEYILIELYTPTGLNEFDTQHALDGYYPTGSNVAGCRVWHVDSRLASTTNGRDYTLETSTTLSNTKGYEHAFTNSTFKTAGDGRCSVLAKTATDPAANFRQLQLIRKDYVKDYKCGDMFDSSDLFQTGDSFNMTTYKNCFYYSGKMNTNTALGFSVKFESVSSTKAVLTITKG